MDLLNNGWHGCNGFSIRHTLIERNIALRWADGTETASVLYFSLGRRPSDYQALLSASKMQNSKLSAALRAKKIPACNTPSSARPKNCVQHTSLGMASTILSMPILSAEFSYPEGVERLIGQGWREATTLSNRSFEDY